MIRLLVILAVSAMVSGGCDRGGATPSLAEQAAHATAETPEPEPVFPKVDDPCADVAPRLVVCRDPASLQAWAKTVHVREPDEASLAPALDPPDPTPIRDGLVVYDELLAGVARQTRSHLELWTNTPTHNARELAEFAADPELWRAVAAFRAAGSAEQIRTVRATVRAKDRRRLRALLLRDGIFYLEDPTAAAAAAKLVALHHLFEDDALVLDRGGLRYLLKRSESGQYLHFEPVLDEANATLHMLDRVGPPSSLAPMRTYELQALRRMHGLSHVVAAAETEAGRPATVRFFDGTEFEGILALDAEHGRLGLVGNPTRVAAIRERNVRDRGTVCSLLEVADLMVRERLDFDEPKVEYGQQDGRLRPRFEKAYEEGRATYTFNGVTYQVFDAEDRPKVPQLCIDFVTDAVQRLHGVWWPPRGAPKPDAQPAFDIREYLRFRSVRSLLQVAQTRPTVAQVVTLPEDRHIPYRRRAEFFENIWRSRDSVREGDVVVIYGLRADNRNHYHSVYVRETDPVYGAPVVLTANPGFARIQAWHDVMWESPRRSIRAFVRWNPDWLRSPQAVDAATRVMERARIVAAGR